MLLDNRHGFKNKLEELNADSEVIEEALSTFDWLAGMMLEHDLAQKLELEEVEKMVGEEICDQAKQNAARRFMEISAAAAAYHYDIDHNRKVGYSAEDGEF